VGPEDDIPIFVYPIAETFVSLSLSLSLIRIGENILIVVSMTCDFDFTNIGNIPQKII
jgi:hypothetical protein